VKEMTPEVGNALFDYIEQGRPVSDERLYVFISQRPPKSVIKPDAVAQVVVRAFRSADVNPNGRSVFPKVFRYSRASRLLKKRFLIG